MTDAVLNTLKATRELLKPRERWTQGGHFRLYPTAPCQIFPADDSGMDQVEFMRTLQSPGLCFCLEGAVFRSATDTPTAEATIKQLTDSIFHRHTAVSVVDFNDASNRTHGEVLEIIDDAIRAISGANQ